MRNCIYICYAIEDGGNGSDEKSILVPQSSSPRNLFIEDMRVKK